MALYAFDGTSREDDIDNARDTNVVRFARAYRGRRVYFSGVGTRFGSPGAVVGGWTGAGIHARINEAIRALRRNWERGDRDIDVVGFSRGAAAARDFANEVRDAVAQGSFGVAQGFSPVRFLGLFDTVASTGILPGPVDLGLDLDLPANVRKCAHAMALDEGRASFHLQRVKPKDGVAPGVIEEVWFRGCHSDIGGGFEHDALANVALVWMLRRATEAGLRFDEEEVMAAMRGRNRAAGITRAPLDKGAKKRAPKAGDLVHCSVRTRERVNGLWHVNPPTGCPVVNDEMLRIGTFPSDFELPPIDWGGALISPARLTVGGAPARIEVFADTDWNELPQIFLEKGARYRFALAEDPQNWTGWNPNALMGAVDRAEHFRIGAGCEHAPGRSGDFGCFVEGDDATHANNAGRAVVSVERVA